MDTEWLEHGFGRIGARVRILPMDERTLAWRREARPPYRIDVRRDSEGTFFSLELGRIPLPDVRVVDTRPRERHLLLHIRDDEGKHKFLCGHDERDWFVAAIPERATDVRDVFTAMEALKPWPVRQAQERVGLRREARMSRKTAAFRRQGEWFFIPATGLNVDPRLVLRNEPIVRNDGGTAHRCEFAFRTGGEDVWVCRQHPSGVTPERYREILDREPAADRWNWRFMRRNALVYARGRISHRDHRSIVLHDWHRVLMNTEPEAKARANVVFLD